MSVIVGSALGQSSARIRITTWNVEWFPNESPHDAVAGKQGRRIESAADVLKKLDPAPTTPAHQVIIGSLILNAQWARNASIQAESSNCLSSED
jgi:hypothetical protein